MGKRLSDTNKWKNAFFRSLDAPYKLFWLYILDDCDHAGIWIVDIDVVKIRIKEDVSLDEAITIFGDKITVLKNGDVWFIKDFIEFQYGELNPKNRVHESVIKILNKYKIEIIKPLTSPLQGAKDKDKDINKDKEISGENENFEPTELEIYMSEREQIFSELDESFKLALKTNIGIERPYIWVNKRQPNGYFDLVDCIIRIREDVEWRSTFQRNNNTSKEKLLAGLYEFVKKIISSQEYLGFDGYNSADGQNNFIKYFSNWFVKQGK